MTTFLAFDNKVSSPVQVKEQNGASQQNKGGPLDREVFISLGTNAYIQNTNMVHKTLGRVFAWHEDHIYRFYQSAIHATAGTFSGGFTFTLGGAWTASDGSFGTFIEDFVAGDGFVKVILGVGSPALTNGATITVTVGGHTCVTTSPGAARGPLGAQGEWGIVHTLPQAPLFQYFSSGIHTVNVGGVSTMCGVYSPGTTTARGWKYNPQTNVFTDDPVSASLTQVNGTNRGLAVVIGNSIMWGASSATTQTIAFIHYNPDTGAYFTTQSPAGSVTGNADQLNGTGYTPALFNGRVFVGAPATGNDFRVFELTGGVLSSLLLFQGNTLSGNPDFNPINANFGNRGAHMMVLGDKLLLFSFGDTNFVNSNGMFIHAMTLVGNTLDCDNIRSDGVLPPTGEAELLARFLLPGTTLPAGGGGSGISLGQDFKLRYYLDERTNDPDGQDLMEVWAIGNSAAGGSTDVLRIGKLVEDLPTLTLDWDNIALNAGNTWDLPTNVDATADLGPVTATGPWVVDPNGRWVRVSAINPGVPNIEVEKPGPWSFAGGVSNRYLNPAAVVNVGIDTGVATLAPPHENRGGGGGIHVNGDKGFAFLGFTSLAADVLITFICEDPAGGTCDITLFHRDEDAPTDTETPLSNLSGGGSLVGNTITGFPSGVVGTVRHTGVIDGAQYRRSAKVA